MNNLAINVELAMMQKRTNVGVIMAMTTLRTMVWEALLGLCAFYMILNQILESMVRIITEKSNANFFQSVS